MIARLKPERIAAYVEMHRTPDPALAAAMAEAHHSDYKLYRLGDYIVATFLYSGEDLAADRARLRARPELADWMKRTAACQEPIDGTAEQIWTVMDLVHDAG
jgi:L-rhamnose mutarotase